MPTFKHNRYVVVVEAEPFFTDGYDSLSAMADAIGEKAKQDIIQQVMEDCVD